MKSFEADAWNIPEKMVLEVEAGRAVVNNQFLKDLFQACMMHDVDYLGIAVRNTYVGPDYRRMAECNSPCVEFSRSATKPQRMPYSATW